MALILDLEAGRFFAVKRATAPHHPAFADQLDAAAHQLNQIGSPPDFLQQSLAITHGGILSQKALERRANPRWGTAKTPAPVHDSARIPC